MNWWLTLQNVHSTGVNWQLVGTLVGGIAAMLGVVLVIIGRITTNVRNEIQNSVQHLAEVLDERLATKEDVNQLSTRVAVLEEKTKNV